MNYKNILIAIILLSLTENLNSQTITRSVISSFGNSYDNNFQKIESTVGETLIETVSDGFDKYLSQGFQQPSLVETDYSTFSVSIEIKNNPVVDDCIVRFKVKDVNDFTVIVSDMLGNIHYTKKLHDVYSGQIVHINFSNLAQGIYTINIFSENKALKRMEKIVKL